MYKLEKKVNKKLKKYIEEEVLTQYEEGAGHGLSHINYVIDRSFEIAENNNLSLCCDMIYTIAAYHDIGHKIDPKRHEIISAEIMMSDDRLKEFFSNEQRIIIKEAIEDHRASSDHAPRSEYGMLVSTADRNNTVNDCLERSYTYGKKLDPSLSDEELFLRAFDVLTKKFGENGYAKFFYKDEQYEQFLKDLRELLKDKERFINTQDEYIRKLKLEKRI